MTNEKKKNSYAEFMKERANRDREFFFGAGNFKKVSNQYAEFKRVLDNDNVIIFTTNIRVINGNFVLIVGNNKAVYLKEWQLKIASSWDMDISGYVVKLNRNYFKPYTFRSEFNGVMFSKDETFDDIYEIAQEQEANNLKLKIR